MPTSDDIPVTNNTVTVATDTPVNMPTLLLSTLLDAIQTLNNEGWKRGVEVRSHLNGIVFNAATLIDLNIVEQSIIATILITNPSFEITKVQLSDIYLADGNIPLFYCTLLFLYYSVISIILIWNRKGNGKQ